MSVMIGIARAGKVVMAADSQWTNGSWNHHEMTRPKIERRGDVLFSVGPASGMEYALWDEVLSVMSEHKEDWWQHWPRHCLGAPNESVIKRLQERDKTDVCQVGWNGRVFLLSVSGCVSEYADGITVSGCGGDYARAVAHLLLKKQSNILAVAVRAVEVACELSAGCAPPIVSEVL